MNTLFLLLLLQIPHPDIVYLGTSDCAGCTKVLPVIQQLEKEGFTVEYVTNRSDFGKYNVTAVPVTILYRNGVEVKRYAGDVNPVEIKAYLRRLYQKDVKVVAALTTYRPLLFNLLIEYARLHQVEITFIQPDQYPIYDITTTPTIIVFENGTETFRLEL